MSSSGHEVVLGPAMTSAAEARRFVGDALESAGATTSREVGVLLASEVVTNALLYAQSRIVVRVSTDDGTTPPTSVRVAVEDASLHPVRERHVGPDATSGRGLAIVAELAERWGVDELPDRGKVVWFELPRR
jgi:anti-sigma regulatory factor (Ser/Thr protein kinase)